MMMPSASVSSPGIQVDLNRHLPKLALLNVYIIGIYLVVNREGQWFTVDLNSWQTERY